jgi:hypothetical protein
LGKNLFKAALLLVSSLALGTEQEGSLNTNNENSTVNSNNVTTDESTTNTYQGAGAASKIPVGSAVSPSYMSSGSDTCLQGTGGSLQTVAVGFSSGGYEVDEDCSRRKDAKTLADLNLKVAAVSRLCQSPSIYRAMLLAGSPCPLIKNGRLVAGKKGLLVIKQQPELYIPDYEDDKDWYNGILGIGKQVDEDVEEDYISISDKYRSSKRSASTATEQ